MPTESGEEWASRPDLHQAGGLHSVTRRNDTDQRRTATGANQGIVSTDRAGSAKHGQMTKFARDRRSPGEPNQAGSAPRNAVTRTGRAGAGGRDRGAGETGAPEGIGED